MKTVAFNDGDDIIISYFYRDQIVVLCQPTSFVSHFCEPTDKDILLCSLVVDVTENFDYME